MWYFSEFDEYKLMLQGHMAYIYDCGTEILYAILKAIHCLFAKLHLCHRSYPYMLPLFRDTFLTLNDKHCFISLSAVFGRSE